jgi:hypothetical protein
LNIRMNSAATRQASQAGEDGCATQLSAFCDTGNK